MQLNELLENNDIKDISKKTNISESALEAIFANEFCYLKRVQCMGFISIIEREYRADLSSLRVSAEQFYANNYEDCSVALAMVDEPKSHKESSKLPLVLLVLVLLVIASWYFINKFDTQHIRTMLPFNEKLSAMFSDDSNISQSLSIESVTTTSETNKSQ
jgi:cytoskeletal protein RodZ